MNKRVTCLKAFFYGVVLSGVGLTLRAGEMDIRFISHRGESMDAPENTMTAFRLALERQMAGFECDVYLTADNEIICLHDATTKRTTDGDLTVANATLAQLKALDAGTWKGAQFAGERIPTFSEALSLARDGTEIYVDIKSGTEIVPRLIQVMAAEPKATPERVVFICFNTNVVAALRQQLPAYRAYWLTGIKQNASGAASPSAVSAIATMQAIDASGLDAQDHALIDATYIQTVKDAGYSFHVWVVNDAARASELAAMGAETITTDCGGRLAAALKPRIMASYGDNVFDPGNNVTQIVDTVISGMGGVIVNPAIAGGGVVLLNGLNTYLGPTFIGCGTLVAASLADGGWPCALGAATGDPANLVLGNGTLRYAGPPVVTDRGYSINVAPDNVNRAAVLHADGDITFGGRIDAVRGNFIKSGTGTVTYAAAGSNQMSRGKSSSLGSVIDFKSNGDSPTVGYSGFNVTAGRVVLGAHAGQINYFTDEFVIGTRTTTAYDMETPAYLDFVGGVHYLGPYLAIGRANGTTTTAPAGLCSRVTVYDGVVQVSNISMGYSAGVAGYNARPCLDVFGGSLEVSGSMRVGDHAGGHPTVNLYGGTTKTLDLVGGIYGATDARINLFSNAVLEVTRNCNLANSAGTLCRLALNGGRFKSGNAYEANAAGNASLYLNGGVFEVRSTTAQGIGATLQVLVSTNGAAIDTLGNTLVVYAGLEHDPDLGSEVDGGLYKSGSGTLELAGVNTYTGPTVISNGILSLSGPFLSATADMTVLAGATFVRTNYLGFPLSINTLTLGSGENPVPSVLTLAADAGACSSLAAASLTLAGRMGVRLVCPGTTNTVTENGTFTLLSYPDTTTLSPTSVVLLDPVPGKLYKFTVAPAGAGRDQLSVTVSDMPAGSVWIDSTGGDWMDADNWSAQPADMPGTPILFTTTAQAGGATVTLPGSATFGSLWLDSAEPYTLNGTGPIVLDNGNAAAVWDVANGSHTVTTPVNLASGTILATRSNTAQNLTGMISGNGSLSVNPAASGGGTVTLAGANTYTDGTRLGCGRLSVNSLADGGQPSAIGASLSNANNLEIGPGTFRYTGLATTSDRGFTINAGSGSAAIFENHYDVTLGGSIHSVSGAFLKSGAGSLTLSGIGPHVLGCNSGNMWSFNDWPDNGDSPAYGFSSFLIANGKMVWGSDGQNVTILNGEAWVGGRTTLQAGQETTGELEITGGYTRIDNFLVVGRDNGTTLTAPVPLQPKLTLSGGWLSVHRFIITYGNDPNHNTHGVCEIYDGTLEVDTEFRLGHQRGNADTPAHATVNMYGGTLLHEHLTQGITMGWSAPACNGTLNLHGGLIDEAADIKMGWYESTSRVNLHGGTLRARNIVGSTGAEYLYLNGGVFQPRGAGQTLAGLTQVLVSTNGVVIDTSFLDADSAYTVNQALLHDPLLGGNPDGGLVKNGAGYLTLLAQAHTFTGPVQVRGGVLDIHSTALQHQTLIASESAGIRLNSGTIAATVANLTLGTNAVGSVEIDLALNNGGSAPLRVTGDLTVNADIEVCCHLEGQMPQMLPSGVYTVLVYKASQAAPMLAKFKTTPDFASKVGAFAIMNVDNNYDAVVMIITPANDASAWNSAESGDWETDVNWTVPPVNAAGSVLLFTNAIPTSGATVSLGGEKTAGFLTFDTLNAFTLTGHALELNNDGMVPRVYIPRGSHTLASGLKLEIQPELDVRSNAALTVTGEISGSAGLAVNPQAVGGGLVTLAGANTYIGPTTASCGTLLVTSLADGGMPSSIGASSADPANLTWGAGTLKYTGPNVVTDRGFTTVAPQGRAAILHTDNDITFGGAIQCASGAFIKRGPGTVTYTGLGNFTLAAHTGYGWAFGEYSDNGDSPSKGFNDFLIADGKMVWGRTGQNMKINGEFWIGTRTTYLPGKETTGELEIRGGYTRMNSYLCLGRDNGDPTTAPVPLMPKLNIYGGTLSVFHFIIGYDSINKHNTRPVLNLYGGLFSVDNHFRFGSHRGSESTPAIVTMNIYGGTLLHKGSYGIQFGTTATAPDGVFNLFGGLVDEAALVKMGQYNTTSRLNLHGGVLKAQNITASTGSEHIFFNGGVFRPTGASLTLANAFNSAVASTNGVVVDTSLAGGGLYTIAQPLTHDIELADAPDGGLRKQGPGTLALSGVNTFTGPVTIETGTLKAMVAGAIPVALCIHTDAIFDANSLTHTVAAVFGEGTLNNGTVRVTDSISPGMEDETPAGAMLTFDGLSLAKGVTLHCASTADGLPTGTVDRLAVTGQLSVEGAGYIDFGRTEDNPLAFPYVAEIMTYDTCDGSFASWRARNTGYPAGSVAMRVIRDESGPVKTVRIVMVRSGTLITVK